MHKTYARRSPVWLRRAAVGYLFILPWLVAYLAFDLLPTVAAFVLSLTDYSAVGDYRWIGLANYAEMFYRDERYWLSLDNTLYYIGFAVPLGIVSAFLLALLLNQPLRGMTLFRTLFYVPAVVPTVAAAIVWLWLFDTRNGALNSGLIAAGLQPIRWLTSPDWAKPALIIMSLWGVGGSMVISLAGLQGIPQEIYEAASIDGANGWRRLVHVTVPLMTPTIFFNLVMGIIGAFQVFNAAFIITAGGPLNSTLFYMLHLYDNAFRFFRLGYASAMAVVLFFIVLGLTLVVFRTSNRWVYYAGGNE